MKMKEKVVRPGGLELPTFWFVVSQESQSRKSISFVWRRLRISGRFSSLSIHTQFCTQTSVPIVQWRCSQFSKQIVDLCGLVSSMRETKARREEETLSRLCESSYGTARWHSHGNGNSCRTFRR